MAGGTLLFHGPYGSGRLAAANVLCAETQTALLVIDTEQALRHSAGWEEIVDLSFREAQLGGAAIYWSKCETLLTRDETDAWGLNNYGMLLFAQGDVANALGPVARAVQVRPTSPVFLNNLGMVLEMLGDKVAARHQYELAVQNDSTYVKAVKNVDRLTGTISDSTAVEEVDVKAVAEQFRLLVQSWKTEVPCD